MKIVHKNLAWCDDLEIYSSYTNYVSVFIKLYTHKQTGVTGGICFYFEKIEIIHFPVQAWVSEYEYELNKNDLDSMAKMIFSASSREGFPCTICTQDFESESMLELHILLGH